MNRFEFRLPDIGEGVSEGEVVAWHVKVGDRVREDDPMCEVMTDKATVTIGAPKAGVIGDLRVKVGETVAVGTVLVVIDGVTSSEQPRSGSVPPPRAPSVPPPRAGGTAASAVGDIREALPGASLLGQAPRDGVATRRSNGNGAPHFDERLANGSAAGVAPSNVSGDKPLATPATRKLARDLGVDLVRVAPSGEGGRITKEDVLRASGVARGLDDVARMPASGDVRTPFVGVRRKIAERMQRAKNTAAHFTFVEECDVSALIALRKRLMPSAESSGVKLSYLPFIVKAVVAALKKHPALNSMLDEAANELVARSEYHIGIATATDQGLMVPVVRHADRRTTLDVAREIERLASTARAGRLSPSELTGSTFTITSLGQQGGLLATPVLNMPEVGILAVHRMRQRPVVRDGEIVIGDTMMLSLSFDHRIIDGHVGAAFAYEVIGFLEEPGRLLLEMA